MNSTVFTTVFSGVLVYVLGQMVLKLVIEPVHEMKKTIAQISHSFIEYDQFIGNPGQLLTERTNEVSLHLRKLSSQIHAHLYLIPLYSFTSRLFGLPERTKALEAARRLRGLSNGLHTANDKTHEINAKTIERVCDYLGIYMPDDER